MTRRYEYMCLRCGSKFMSIEKLVKHRRWKHVRGRKPGKAKR